LNTNCGACRGAIYWLHVVENVCCPPLAEATPTGHERGTSEAGTWLGTPALRLVVGAEKSACLTP